MKRSGYTEMASTLAIAGLLRKGIIEDGVERDYDGHSYAVYKASKKGLEWLLENQSKFQLTIPAKSPIEDEDIP